MKDEQNDTQDPLARLKETASSHSAITAIVVGGLVAGVMSGRLDVPAWAIDVMRGGAVASVIGYIAGQKLAEIFSEPPEYEEVGVVDSEREILEKWFVPPDAWEERRNESDADSGAYVMSGSGNYVVRELDWDDEEEVAVIEQAPARQKVNERTDVEIETWVDAIWRQRGEFRDTVFEAAEIVKNLPEMMDEVALDYYRNETREIAEHSEHDEESMFRPIDRRVNEIREEVKRDDLTEEEKAVREMIRDAGGGVDASDFERIDRETANDFQQPEKGGEDNE
ncbi:hemerythrin domain-containing protein [Halomicrobium sp. LC1Hm]|uniref:hemerythrin domain-containing protein n=1 Tax=Halomicrobium sp. LC1Hm TaxID=2610902 RepID=UPI00129826FF|nr:hemerythrin domain-containing protein [Halomicrobium sp. LC1Hm]QGA82014.1 hypothetical protein LC1Hm_0952 [Halomicrobium sp. LC1Hm]